MDTGESARGLAVIGNPNSLGSYAAGQDLAPQALRAAGLLRRLAAGGRAVTDLGDLPHRPWRPGPPQPVRPELAGGGGQPPAAPGPAGRAAARRRDVLLLGGNCTGALAAVAALQEATATPAALLYLDRYYDANTPRSVTDAALDWMGIAHALALPDTVDALVDAFGPRPLLAADRLVYLGVEAARATDWERAQSQQLCSAAFSGAELAADPAGSAAAALAALPDCPLVVNIDVDVLDFTDAPLAEDTAGRNSGPTLSRLAQALAVLVADPRTRLLSISELNPTRCAAYPEALESFAAVLTGALVGTSAQ